MYAGHTLDSKLKIGPLCFCRFCLFICLFIN